MLSLEPKIKKSPTCCKFENFDPHPQLGYRQCWPEKKNCQNRPTENGQYYWPTDKKKESLFLRFKEKKTAN